MEARDLIQGNLVGVIGSRGVVSEVMNSKRSISKAQAKALGEFFICRTQFVHIAVSNEVRSHP